MDEFPDSVEFTIVADLYENYDVILSEDGERVHVYCERCDDVVADLSDAQVDDMNWMDLYEEIVTSHREL